MTRVIERDILALDFDGRGFYNGIQKSLDHINTFQNSLDFDDAVRSLSSLNAATNLRGFANLGAGIASVTNRLSAMGIIAGTVINQITTGALNAAKRLFDVALIAPLRDGLAEYELQIGSIQTILANTSSKGTTLEDVTTALDELNLFADKTIFNFAHMTDSIGKFTAAGVDLDVSVDAIKGIANLSALSGANTQQASNAMVQLSQAIATGVVKLQDWNSVVNAGIGGEVFQKALIDTARAHGVAIDTIIDRNGGFRASLQEGWLSSTILLDTLRQFTGDLTDQQLEAIGFTQEQIVSIQELAVTANDAATKIKTITQLRDTLAEAMQSGWSETWRIIFGDFEEAKEVFGDISDVLSGLVGASANVRNELLTTWDELGGRNELIRALFNIIEGGIQLFNLFRFSIRQIFPPVTAQRLFELTKLFADLTEGLRFGSPVAQKLNRIIRGFAAGLDILKLFVLALLRPLGRWVGVLEDGVSSVSDIAATVGDYIFNLRNSIIETDFFNKKLQEFGLVVLSGIAVLKSFLDSILELDVIRDVIAYFSSITRSDINNFLETLVLRIQATAAWVREMISQFLRLPEVQAVFDVLSQFTWENIRNFLTQARSKLPEVIEKFNEVKNSVLEFVDGVKELRDNFLESSSVQSFLGLFENFKGEAVQNFFDGVINFFLKLPGIIGEGASKLFDFLKTLDFSGLIDFLDNALTIIFDTLSEAAKRLDFEKIVAVLTVGLGALFIKKLGDIFSGDFFVGLLEDFFGGGTAIGEAAIGALGAVEETFVSFQNNLKADTLLKIAGAIGIVTASVVTLSLLDPAKVIQATAALGTLIGGLLATSTALTRFNIIGVTQATGIMIGLAASVLVLSIAIRILAKLDVNSLARGLIGVAVGLGILVLATKALGASNIGIARTAGGMILLSAALVVLAGAIFLFGSIPYDKLEQGLIGIGIALAGLVAFSLTVDGKELVVASAGVGLMGIALFALSKSLESLGSLGWEELARGLIGAGVALLGLAGFSHLVNPVQLITSGVGIGIMALALIGIAHAITMLAQLSWEEIARGLIALAGALVIIAIGTSAMTGALLGAAAMLVVSVALLALAAAMRILGGIGWEGILQALVALAGVFVVLGIAGVLLGPVSPVLIAIGVAMLLMGAAALLLGGAIFLASAGLIALAGSASIVASAITLIGGSILELIPRLVTAIAEGMVQFVVTIAEARPRLLKAAKDLFILLIEVVVEIIPLVVDAILSLINALLATLAENAPEFVKNGFKLLLALMKGIEDNIQEVVETALGITTKFIEGITEGIPDLIAAGFAFILAYINAMADAIDLYLPDILLAGKRLGDAIVDGIKEALAEGLASVISEAGGLAQAAIDAMKQVWETQSPSKVSRELAGFFVEGITGRFKDGAKSIFEGSQNLAENAREGLLKAASRMEEIILGGADFQPVITPVLDSGDALLGMRQLNSALNSPSLNRVNAGGLDDEINSRRRRGDDPGEGGQTIQFIQNNNSPKALSAEEIYRNTNSQLAQLSRRSDDT